MIICSWNVIGLNKSFKQREFKSFLNKNKVDSIGCFETRVKKPKAPSIHKKFGMEWRFADRHFCPNDRIWIGQRSSTVTMTTLDSSSILIHCQVKDKSSSFTSFITFMNELADRKNLWDQLKHITTVVSGP